MIECLELITFDNNNDNSNNIIYIPNQKENVNQKKKQGKHIIL